MSSNHFCFFFSLPKKTNENESVIKFASEMEITFLLLSLYAKLRLKELYAATALCLLCSLELSLSNTESLGFHGNLSYWCLPCTGFYICLPQKSFYKNSIFTLSAHRKSVFIDFLYSLGKMVFFIYNYFMPLLRFLSGCSIWPHSTDFKAYRAHVTYFSNEIPGNCQCVFWCWRNITCFCSLSCALILHCVRRAVILGRCISLAWLLEWETLGHRCELERLEAEKIWDILARCVFVIYTLVRCYGCYTSSS